MQITLAVVLNLFSTAHPFSNFRLFHAPSDFNMWYKQMYYCLIYLLFYFKVL